MCVELFVSVALVLALGLLVVIEVVAAAALITLDKASLLLLQLLEIRVSHLLVCGVSGMNWIMLMPLW